MTRTREVENFLPKELGSAIPRTKSRTSAIMDSRTPELEWASEAGMSEGNSGSGRGKRHRNSKNSEKVNRNNKKKKSKNNKS